MELSKDDIAFIKGLSQKMKTQDNRGTAQPYALIIGEKIRENRDPRRSDRIVVYWNECDYESIDELVAAIEEYYEDENHPAIEYIRKKI